MHTKEIKNMEVSEVMTTDLHCVLPDTLLSEIAKICEKKMIHHVPVIDNNGILLGIISSSDLDVFRDFGIKYGLHKSELKTKDIFNSTTAIQACEKRVMCIHPENTLHEVYEIFRQNTFRSLPVIDYEGKIVGIITPYDIMKVIFLN